MLRATRRGLNGHITWPRCWQYLLQSLSEGPTLGKAESGGGVRILVTGGAGFIGSHVVDAFLAAGHEVAVLDNLSTGRRENLNPSARFYGVDLRQAEAVNRVLSDFRPEVVDHHAAQSEVPKSVEDPICDAEINLLGGLNLLLASRATGVRKFIFISTGGALYGEPDSVPCTEDAPIRPLSPYGTSKFCFEQYLGTFKRTFGLDYTVLRYANIYGPRQGFETEEGRVVAMFASRMLLGRAVTIDGTGEQCRDMLYVSDAACANIAAVAAGSGETFNIGTGVPVSVNQIFEVLRDFTGYSLPPKHGPFRKGDVFKIALDSTKAARELGWTPEVSLRDGLAATLDDFRRMPDLAGRLDAMSTSMPG